MSTNIKAIELVGVGLPNRGAEFMARTVMENLKGLDVVFLTQYGPDEQTTEEVGMRFAKPMSADPGNKEYHSFRERSGKIYDVAARIDISGFAYGDFWGERKFLGRATPQIVGSQRFNIPYFVLPQSMGPFNTFENKKIFRSFVEEANLFCVRDISSLADVEDMCPWVSKLLPDICLSETSYTGLGEDFRLDREYATIILNSKLIESGIYKTATHYMEDIKSVVSYLNSIDVCPVLLNHEGAADEKLIRMFSDRLSIYSFEPGNLSEILEVIKNSRLVCTSRYHGMISALKFEVPIVVVGWSNKYSDTLNEYFDQAPLLSPGFKQVDLLGAIENNQSRLQEKKVSQSAKHALNSMWSFLRKELDEIF